MQVRTERHVIEAKADKYGIKYKIIHYPDGIHRFDVLQPTEESKEIIKRMLKEIVNEMES